MTSSMSPALPPARRLSCGQLAALWTALLYGVAALLFWSLWQPPPPTAPAAEPDTITLALDWFASPIPNPPAAAPVLQDRPEPTPVAEPEPEPVPESNPEPEPIQVPEPVPVPEPEPKLEPKPETKPKPKPEPRPEKRPTPVSALPAEMPLSPPAATPAVAPTANPETARNAEVPTPAPVVEPPSADAERRWHAAISQRIQSRLRYPPLAKRLGLEGTARVRFTVSADGSVSSLTLAETSGDSSLDQAALDAVQDSSPLPPPPAGLDTPVTLSQPVRFQLRR